MAEGTALPSVLEHVFRITFHLGRARRATDQHSPSGQGAGGWALAMAGRVSPEVWPGTSSPSKEDRKADLS